MSASNMVLARPAAVLAICCLWMAGAAASTVSKLYGNTLICQRSTIPDASTHYYITRNNVFVTDKFKGKGDAAKGQVFPLSGRFQIAAEGWTGSRGARLEGSELVLDNDATGPFQNVVFHLKSIKRVRFRDGNWEIYSDSWQRILTPGQRATVPYSREIDICDLVPGRHL